MRLLSTKYIVIFLTLYLSSKTLSQNIITLQVPKDKKTIKFIVLSDIHISNDKSKDEKLTRFVDVINASNDIDLIAITGDIVSSIFPADKHKSDRNNRLIKAINILKKLRVPFYLAMGNHDYKIDNERDSDASFSTLEINYMENLWTRITKLDPYYSIRVGRFSFIFLNSVRGRPYNRYLDNEQIHWFEKELRDSDYAIIFVHHPPADGKLLSVLANKKFITQKTDEIFFKVLKNYKHKVKAIFCGHLHKKLYYEIFEQIPVYVSDSFGESKLPDMLYVELVLDKTCSIIIKQKTLKP